MRRIITLSFLLLSLALSVSGKTYYVSNDGDDLNPGTVKETLRTISRAAELAMPGDTVFVMEGIYRERVAPPRSGSVESPIVFMGEPKMKVLIKGSEIWNPDWQAYGNDIYYAIPHDSLFNDSLAYEDSHNPFKVYLASTPYGREGGQEVLRGFPGDPNMFYTCGQVFINGVQYKEVPYMSELDQTFTWHYAQETNRIYINFGLADPALQEVEITTRRRLFAPRVYNLGYIVVEGFIMEHCGNQYPTNFWNTPRWGQRGAVGTERGNHWIIRNNLIRFVKTFAIDAGYVTVNPGESSAAARANIVDNIIENNYILENGAAGIMASQTERMIIRDNVIMYNNTMDFYGQKRWEHGGIKCHNPRNGLIIHNYVAENFCQGIWLDNKYDNVRVSKNVVINNPERGIFLELSTYNWDESWFDQNILVGNEQNQIYTHDASGATFVHNLIANTKDHNTMGQGVLIHKVSDRNAITGNHTFYGNLFAGNRKGNIETNYPRYEGAAIRSDYNVFDSVPAERPFAINNRSTKPIPWPESEFKTLMETDLGIPLSTEPTVFSGGFRVLLQLKEWKAFWDKLGYFNDHHSHMIIGTEVGYERNSGELKIEIPFDPSAIGSHQHWLLTDDFFGQPFPADGTASPGPFQNLEMGENVFRIWDGASIPEMGWDGSPNPEKYKVSFQLTDKDLPLEGVIIQSANRQIVSDSMGGATLQLGRGEYNYFVYKDNYSRVAGSYLLEKDTAIKIELSQISADLRFIFTDNAGPSEGVEVILEGESRRSSSTGIVDFNGVRIDTLFTYTAYKEDFTTLLDSFSLKSDSLIRHHLEASVAWIKFRVKDKNGQALQDAIVSLDDSRQTTNMVGITTFRKRPIDSLYIYEISKEDHPTFRDDFILEGDTTIEVRLIPTLIKSEYGDGFHIYPNPASSVLIISGTSQGVPIEIMDHVGKLLLKTTSSGKIKSISMESLPPGIYLVRIGENESVKIIKN